MMHHIGSGHCRHHGYTGPDGRCSRPADAAAFRTSDAADAADPVARLAGWVADAPAVLIAASNGFDFADGYNQFSADSAFMEHFGDLAHSHGLRCILHGLAAHWPDGEAQWDFLSRLVDYAYADYTPSPAMRAARAIVAGRPYFVTTCNYNGRFQRAGFDPDRLLETEGSLTRLWCAHCGSVDEYDTAVQRDAAAGPAAVPRCPHCGTPLTPAIDDTGRQRLTRTYCDQRRRLDDFLEREGSDGLLVLELGVGPRNAALRAPLVDHALRHPRTRYAVINREPVPMPQELHDRSLLVRGDIEQVLAAVTGAAPGAEGCRR